MAININLPSVTQSYTNLASFPSTGSVSILYKALNNNKLYTWDGSKYNEIDKRFASSWGSVSAAPETTSVTKDEVGLGNVDNTSDADKPISTATQTALNTKQATLVSGSNIKTINSTSLVGSGDVAVQPTLVSGTNIKTINGSSVLGSGNLVVSGGGGGGIHALVKPRTGVRLGYALGISTTGSNFTLARLTLVPFIPANTFTISEILIYCNILGVGSLCRLLIYSDNNGFPDAKLFESADLNLSTIGFKIATTTFTFNAGTTYWLGFHGGGVTANVICNNNAVVYPFAQTGTTPNGANGYNVSAALGSAPANITTATLNTASPQWIALTPA
jgi:hypothetical protein